MPVGDREQCNNNTSHKCTCTCVSYRSNRDRYVNLLLRRLAKLVHTSLTYLVCEHMPVIAGPHTHTHALTHACTRTHTHALTHTHIHSLPRYIYLLHQRAFRIFSAKVVECLLEHGKDRDLLEPSFFSVGLGHVFAPDTLQWSHHTSCIFI